MADSNSMVLYAASYESASAAMTALDDVEQLHKDQMDGKPHIVKRMDRPGIRVVPEWFGGGALPRKELREAAEALTANAAGLIVVGEPTIEKALDKALTGAAKVVKHEVDATTDQIAGELQEALKG